ncbi:hypothetical protein CKA32_005902 [Geitlerinema sp. FC II]|nr:hypothetical protein CKA32_005902 [Geitlerinema sp. FC II]
MRELQLSRRSPELGKRLSVSTLVERTPILLDSVPHAI